MSEGQTLEFTEFETKYKVDGNLLYDFKKLIESLEGIKRFVYVQGPDVYFTKSEDEFLRYRKAEHDKSNRAELTGKVKVKEQNNIIRKEVNLRVDFNDSATVHAFAEMLGFSYNFTIWKMCHIYDFEDATIVFYSVKDEANVLTHFLEIEVSEKTEFTEEQAWGTIRKWEAILKPLEITAQNRLRKSLFEMYRKGPKNERKESQETPKESGVPSVG